MVVPYQRRGDRSQAIGQELRGDTRNKDTAGGTPNPRGAVIPRIVPWWKIVSNHDRLMWRNQRIVFQSPQFLRDWNCVTGADHNYAVATLEGRELNCSKW